MKCIPDELIVYLNRFISNYDILQFYQSSKRLVDLYKKYDVLMYVLNRKHPIVFNVYDNYCYKCNLYPTILSLKKDFIIMRCNHN